MREAKKATEEVKTQEMQATQRNELFQDQIKILQEDLKQSQNSLHGLQ